jgi:hypothetical protein
MRFVDTQCDKPRDDAQKKADFIGALSYQTVAACFSKLRS